MADERPTNIQNSYTRTYYRSLITMAVISGMGAVIAAFTAGTSLMAAGSLTAVILVSAKAAEQNLQLTHD